jgi:hypothetical protein
LISLEVRREIHRKDRTLETKFSCDRVFNDADVLYKVLSAPDSNQPSLRIFDRNSYIRTHILRRQNLELVIKLYVRVFIFRVRRLIIKLLRRFAVRLMTLPVLDGLRLERGAWGGSKSRTSF